GLALASVNLTIQGPTGLIRNLTEVVGVPSLNVAFPASILFYSAGAIMIEVIYRLILIALPFWLISRVILRNRGRTAVFWVLAIVVSALEPLEQASLVPHLGLALVLILSSVTYAMNLYGALLLWRYGLLASISFRLGYYIVWHMVGSVLG